MGTEEGKPVNRETEVSKVITLRMAQSLGEAAGRGWGLEKDLEEMDSQRVAEPWAILAEFHQVLFHQPVKGGKQRFPPQRGLRGSKWSGRGGGKPDRVF